jgi:hypothetical protein
MQEVVWNKRGKARARDYSFSHGKENENQLGTGFFVIQALGSVVKRVWFVSDRLSGTV